VGLTRAQVDAGHTVQVLTTDALNPNGARIPKLTDTFESISIFRAPNFFSLSRKLNLSTPVGMVKRYLTLDRSQPIDVVHLHEFRTIENLLITPQLRPETRIILSAHGTLPHGTGRSWLKKGWDRVFSRRVAERIKGGAALTENEADQTRELWATFGLPPPTLQVIPNGVEIPQRWRFTERPYDTPDTTGNFTVLYVGRLHERKGLQFLIPAFAKAALPNTRLVIAGPDEGMLGKLQTLTRELGVTDRVEFMGYTRNLSDLYATADLFVLAAEGEGQSMAVLEAMAHGLPALLTPGCHFPDSEKQGVSMIVEREIEALQMGLTHFMTDSHRRARMGVAARAWMVRAFSWSAVVEQMDRLYRSV
jgi:glycosyltransferase involved in cell wall biosynthesis